MLHRRLLALLPVLSLAACGEAAPHGGADVAPTVELGTGRSRFEPIAPVGGALELVGGPQGGFHVFVAARLTGLDVEGLSVEFAAFDAVTGEAVGRVATLVLARDRVVPDGASWVRSGDILILDDASPEPVRDRTLEIRLRAQEAGGGASASDSRTVRVVDEVSG